MISKAINIYFSHSIFIEARVYFACKQSKPIRGVDILHLLKSQKPFPIGYPGWRLNKYEYEQRLWKSELVSDVLPNSIPIYGSFAKIKASSQTVLNTLKDINKYHEWNPGVCQTRQITVADEVNQPSKHKGSSSGVVQHDIVSIEIEHMPYLLARFVNWVWYKIQGDGLLRLVSLVHRYWNKQESNTWWFLEMMEREQKWYFYLLQNIEGFFEIDQILVTVISSPEPDAAIKLACLQHVLSYRKVQTAALTNISLPVSSVDENEEGDTTQKTTMQSNPVDQLENSTKPKLRHFAEVVDAAVKNNPQTSNPSSSQTKSSDFVLKFKQLIEEKKDWFKSDERRKKANQRDAANILKPTEPSNKSETKDKKFFSRFLNRSNTSPDVFEGIPKDQLPIQLRSVDQESSTKITEESDKLSIHSDEESSNSILTDEESDIHMIRGIIHTGYSMDETFRKAANEAANELLNEKAHIANLDIMKTMDEQAEATSGWVYCGLEKEIVILRKVFDDSGSNLQCYLGKGVVPAAPKTVFEAVRNPQTRFTYDEMLKKTEVLHDFGNGLKVIYLYHEVSQLFRKEARDFCIVQLEKMDGVKYVVSMRSVGWPGCEETESTTRGKVHPSGWIIEPITRDQKLYSMVTYITQFELGLSKTGTGYLVEELAAKQPLAISFLRQVLTQNPLLAEGPDKRKASVSSTSTDT
ncbi:DgyrCDS9779 [Dimorphilus gyrociliatus]|uniref:DgyrCDS9779 n=1 Tax=Dimorphilus gyrociliatus TaxID=2664684 RepID=A0A7I8VYD1_9ANNE|nr:DgyrCDS9779 [Dimorphilus gyrociliatus]